jgi:DNA polymerase-1
MQINYKYIRNEIPVEVIEDICTSQIVACDCETTSKDLSRGMEFGLESHRGQIRLLQLATKSNCYIFDWLLLAETEKIKIRKCFKCISILIGFNFKFDTKFLFYADIDPSDCGIIFDCMIAAQSIEKGLETHEDGEFTLKSITKRYLDIDLSKEEQLSDWSQIELTDDQLEYAALDVIILHRLREVQKALLVEKALGKSFKNDVNSIVPTAAIEHNGMCLDVDYLHSLLPKYELKLKESGTELYKRFNEVYYQNSFIDEVIYNFSITSNTQLLYKLQELGIPDPEEEGLLIQSCGKNKLKLLDELEFPVVDDLLDYRNSAKRLSTYIIPLPDHINPVTKRIHTNLSINSTSTGRFSSRNVNLQNQPRDSEFRNSFIAPEGMLMISADLSAIEVKVMAELSKDKKLIEFYNKGLDVYVATVCFINNIEIEDYYKLDKKIQKDLRQKGKVYVLGLQYSMQWRKLQKYAKQAYGVLLTLLQAKESREKFFQLYSGIASYHEYAREFPKRTGYMEALDGRKKFGEAGYTESTNWPDQATSASIVKLAMYNFYMKLKEKGYSPILDNSVQFCCTVHDQLDTYAREDIAEEIRDLKHKCLVEAGSEYVKVVPITAEAGIGKRWGECH